MLKKIVQTKNENSSVRKSKQERLMLLSNCVVCGKKKLTFIKNKELSNFNNIWNDWFKMNKIINKFLLTGVKFMPELHLKQPGFTYIVIVEHLVNIVEELKNLEKEVI